MTNTGSSSQETETDQGLHKVFLRMPAAWWKRVQHVAIDLGERPTQFARRAIMKAVLAHEQQDTLKG